MGGTSLVYFLYGSLHPFLMRAYADLDTHSVDKPIGRKKENQATVKFQSPNVYGVYAECEDQCGKTM